MKSDNIHKVIEKIHCQLCNCVISLAAILKNKLPNSQIDNIWLMSQLYLKQTWKHVPSAWWNLTKRNREAGLSVVRLGTLVAEQVGSVTTTQNAAMLARWCFIVQMGRFLALEAHSLNSDTENNRGRGKNWEHRHNISFFSYTFSGLITGLNWSSEGWRAWGPLDVSER